jgi:signal transduction histidine kinase
MENVPSVYRNKLLAHNISVEKKFNDLRKIKVRSGEIIQVFSNLVSNAIDAMPQAGGPRFRLETRFSNSR